MVKLHKRYLIGDLMTLNNSNSEYLKKNAVILLFVLRKDAHLHEKRIKEILSREGEFMVHCTTFRTGIYPYSKSYCLSQISCGIRMFLSDGLKRLVIYGPFLAGFSTTRNYLFRTYCTCLKNVWTSRVCICV